MRRLGAQPVLVGRFTEGGATPEIESFAEDVGGACRVDLLVALRALDEFLEAKDVDPDPLEVERVAILSGDNRFDVV